MLCLIPSEKAHLSLQLTSERRRVRELEEQEKVSMEVTLDRFDGRDLHNLIIMVRRYAYFYRVFKWLQSDTGDEPGASEGHQEPQPSVATVERVETGVQCETEEPASTSQLPPSDLIDQLNNEINKLRYLMNWTQAPINHRKACRTHTLND